MAKRYKYESFTCINYDDMMETYNQMYAEDYQLIGYRLFKSSELYQKSSFNIISKKKRSEERWKRSKKRLKIRKKWI